MGKSTMRNLVSFNDAIEGMNKFNSDENIILPI